MKQLKFFIVLFLLVFILAISGVLCAQRVFDLDKMWGDMRVLGDDGDDYSGNDVAYGDINGDGFMDIIIGAHGADPGDPARGWAGETYVIFGSSSPYLTTIDLNTQTADITVWGVNSGDASGCAVASGDINGDGYDDLIIGAYAASPGGLPEAGETYVIFGESFSSPTTIDLKTQADITVCGASADDLSGNEVSSGDVNGDGYDDIIISAPWADPGGRSKAGETYVIFGESFSSPTTIDLKTQADITVCGAAAEDWSSYEVSSGDVNGDGYDDVIIGAPFAYPGDPPRSGAGETYVIFGSASPPSTVDLSTTSADITVCGAVAGDWSGYAVASGDINGDGCNDILIGAPYAALDVYIGPIGGTYVIFGKIFSSPTTIDLSSQTADITVWGDSIGAQLGSAVASGDANGDGYDDLIIGAYFADPGGRNDAGKSYVIFGFNPSSPVVIDLSKEQADIAVCGDDNDDFSGCSVAGGDFNGDGFDDIIIGANGADPVGGTSAGETYLIAGGGAFVTAHGLGGKSWVKEFSLMARDWGSFKAFGTVNSQGEVHLAVGEIDGDGYHEIAAGQGEGGKSWVKFFEVDGTFISTFKAFGASNTNGELHLAIGNFDTDTADNETVIAQGEGGQSWVKVFEVDGTFIRSIKAFGAANAQGEVHVASGDLNKDGIDEIIAGMGEGGSSWVKVFNLWGDLVRSFRAFDATDNPGGEVRLVVGNFDADPAVEIAVATGYNGGNKVRLFDKDGTPNGEFTAFGFGGNTNGDVQVAAADIDNDGVDELICAHGEGGSSQVKVFKANGTAILSFKAFGGVNAQGEVHLGKSNY